MAPLPLLNDGSSIISKLSPRGSEGTEDAGAALHHLFNLRGICSPAVYHNALQLSRSGGQRHESSDTVWFELVTEVCFKTGWAPFSPLNKAGKNAEWGNTEWKKNSAPSFLLFSFYIFFFFTTYSVFVLLLSQSHSLASNINLHVTSDIHVNPVNLTVVPVSYSWLLKQVQPKENIKC